MGERERRVREAGKATNELVQLQHSSVLLLQFARLPSQMQPVALFAAALAAQCPRCPRHRAVQCAVQSVTPTAPVWSPAPSTVYNPPLPPSELPLRGLLRTTENGRCCSSSSLDRLCAASTAKQSKLWCRQGAVLHVLAQRWWPGKPVRRINWAGRRLHS